MNGCMLKFIRLLPALTLAFTILVFCVTVCIDTFSPWFVIFIFMSIEVYINWIAIYVVSYIDVDTVESNESLLNDSDAGNSRPSVIVDLNSSSPAVYRNNYDNCNRWQNENRNYTNPNICSQNIDIRKIWYCPKCHTNTPLYCHHCPLCKKCVVFRDHHCLFLGACICLQNMGHFIILCTYVGLVSIYVNSRLFPFLCSHFETQEEGVTTLWHLSSRCFFPVALGKWLSGQEELLFLSLVALFDVLVSTAIFTFGFGMYHLYLVVTGQSQRRLKGIKECYDVFSNKKISFTELKYNFVTMFGKWGVLNFLFPVVLLKNILHLKYFRREFKFH